MQFLSYFAIYFIIWWISLFAVLPFGLRTQAEENEVVAGSAKSAPARFRAFRIFLVNSLVALAIFGIWYVLTQVMGMSAESLPRIAPTFD